MDVTTMMDSKRGMMMGNNTCMGMNMSMPTNQMNMMMIPRATMKMDKCEDGMKVMCMTTDTATCAMMQNLCTMLSGGMTSMCMMMNGMMIMNCNMLMGMCKSEMTEEGMCITWSSGDTMMCEMIHECCECMMSMMECGCNTIMCMNNTPVCCG
ncbi:hypothetical protein [Clostridium sp. YIM B02555]|uniref:hypothetical protein n=1 Tax=Clostridium sp. YIM B02555 TaxID=2911968 RepID=UPI001EED817B|nr:hypothetical protein [Clostridium sp. YIM B02555]